MPTKQTTTKKPVKKTVRKTSKPATTVEKANKPAAKPQGAGRFIESVGRRKTSVARVRLFTSGNKEITVNEKEFGKYFPTKEMQETVLSPLGKTDALAGYRVIVKVQGGGIHSQSEAVRHGIARALLTFDSELKSALKKAGFLTRDARMRERKKFGLKRARRAPQWRKR